MTQKACLLNAGYRGDFRQMSQSMTDNACHIVAAFSLAPIMTQQAVATLTGLSLHATGFILEQMQLSGIVMVNDNHWRITESFRKYLSGIGTRVNNSCQEEMLTLSESWRGGWG